MVYDEALYKFSKSAEVEYLPWRVWISFWCLIIAATVACFQGSFVVKFFTKFTKDVFASFIATVFIYEALLKTAGVSTLILHLDRVYTKSNMVNRCMSKQLVWLNFIVYDSRFNNFQIHGSYYSKQK